MRIDASKGKSATIRAMCEISVSKAIVNEFEWAAGLMSGTDPWITLGRGLEACRKACNDPACDLFIAHCGSEPCGFLLLHPKGVAGSPYVRSIATAAGSRNRGIGSLLLQHVESIQAAEARFIFLCVSSFNTRARALYERRGYSLVGELKDYVIDGLSEFLMIKRLVQP
jgi:[ribosomal protein S18]-alanine N-acetyltransferase